MSQIYWKRNWSSPCRHKCQHDEGIGLGRIVLRPRFCSIPLGHTEDLDIQDAEEEEHDEPQTEQAQNDR